MSKKIMSVLTILIGIGLLAYPWISNYVSQHAAKSEVSSYEEAVENLTDDEYAEMLADAQRYNEELASAQVVLTDPFQEEEIVDDDLSYWDLLNLTENGIMGYIEIPCINVSLPVYHGTAASTLEKGVGHLQQTSLPVGGASTHAVLTGHTGLNNAKLFTDLTELEEGDLFYIHTLGETLAYEVDQINIVLPENTSDLTIIDGEDHVTLVTCTPYGVNTHRLLVRGVRTEYVESEYDNAFNETKESSQWMSAYRTAVIIGIAVSCGLLLFIYLINRLRQRKKGISK